MAKVGKPVCKICRKFTQKLYLKGRRCDTSKCPIEVTKNVKFRGKRPKKISEYGVQLREKNKVKVYYGVLERQFSRYFEIARNMKGVTGETLLQMLECRLDNTVYELNWSYSRRMARQMVVAGAVTVNGRKIDKPGHVVKVGDEITMKEKSRYSSQAKTCVEELQNSAVPAWIETTPNVLKGKILRLPTRSEVTVPAEEQLIVNLYSK